MPQAQSGLEIKMKAGLGFNANQLSWPVMAGEFSQPNIKVRHTLEEVDIDEANLEAEVGETAVTNLNADGVPEQYKIGGKRHYEGGTPLNLPDNSYIFSRDNSMKIKDPEVLSQFGMTKFPRSGVTPADIAKKYDLNKYKKILLDKESDDMARSTAEMMISNYMQKLGKLAIIQESMKGFPEGIPLIAMPYLEHMGMDPQQILPSQDDVYGIVQAEQENPQADTGEARYGRQLPIHATPPGNVGGGYEYRILPLPNPYGKPIWIKRNLTNNTDEPMTDPNFIPPGGKETASQALARTASRTSSKTNTAAASSGTSSRSSGSTRTSSPGLTVDKAFPPLGLPPDVIDRSVYHGSDAAYDPRLSERSNKKFSALVGAINSKPEVKEAIISRYKEILGRGDKSNKLNANEKAILLGMKDEDIIRNFLQYQKQNWAMADADEARLSKDPNAISAFEKVEKGGLGFDTDNYNKDNVLTKNILKNMGFEKDGVWEGLDVAGVQATAQAVTEVMNMPEHQEQFKGFGIRRKGTHTDKGNYVDASGKLTETSAIDKRSGDDTNAWLVDYEPTPEPEKEKDKIPDPEPDPLKKPEIEETVAKEKAPWWIQDIVKTSGAFMDWANIKKYMPWQAVPDVDYLDPTFYSPERELAANAEQLAIGAEGAAQFTGPQAYNARFSQMSGKAAANAADILGRYNNLNVGVANEAEKFNVETFNNYAIRRADDATKLYDKVTIANQQFDNAKNQARQQIRQSYIDAITNRADAYNYNQIYPDWAIDPMSGGMLRQKPPRDIDPNEYRQSDYATEINKWMERRPRDVSETDWLDQYNIMNGYQSYGTSKQKRTPQGVPGYGTMSGSGYPMTGAYPGYSLPFDPHARDPRYPDYNWP